MTRLDNDLISRKDLIEYFKENSNGDYTEWFLENIEDAINDAPTIEADSGEAVAWISNDCVLPLKEDGSYWLYPDNNDKLRIPLFTSPQKREWVELNLKQLDRIYLNNNSLADIAKAIQAKLKEVNHG